MESFGFVLRLSLAFSLAISCFAQNPINLPPINVRGQVVSAGIDASSGPTKPAQYGTSLPATCGIWSIFLLSTATPGENAYICTSANVWTQFRMSGTENALTFTSPLSRATDTISLLGWGSGSRPVMAGSLGTSGNCAQWGAAGLTDAGAPCGSGGGSGANALGFYLVNQSTNAPANAINLGLLTSSLLKITVSGGVATLASAVAGTDFVTGADSRLTDSRTPTTHGSSHLSTGSDPIAAASTTVRGSVTTTTANSQVASTDDSRLSNARTPTAHAASHQTGGSDEVATETPTSNAIPKAGSGGKLNNGWIDFTPYVPTSRTVNGKALTSNIALSAADVGALGASSNAVSASKLATPRNINGIPFDGTADITIPFSGIFLDAKINCGLVMDGTTDDTSALNTCISGLPAGGGQIRFPVGTAVINNLTIQKDNVILIGAGAANAQGITTPLTKFRYTSTAGGYVVRWYKASTILRGGEFRGIGIDANSLAAQGLWLRNTDGFRGMDFSVFNHTGYGVILDVATSIVGSCGDGSGSNFLDNFVIWSTSGGGLQMGSAGTLKDVCSNKLGRGNITYSGLPGWHGLWIAHGDSNSFADLDIGEYGGKTVSGISCTSNVCTVTASSHGQSTTDGIAITGASDYRLNGAHMGTVASSNTFTISVTIPNGSYTATKVSGSSVQLGVPGCTTDGSTGCAWNNSFGKLLTTVGVYKFPNSFFDTLYPNHISQWNWTETSGGSLGFARLSGVAGSGIDGSLYNATFRTAMNFQPVDPVAYAFVFKAGTIVDYGVGLDFSNADPLTSVGYYPMRMHNATMLASTTASKASNIEVIGVDSDDNLRIGSVFNPAATYTKIHSRLQFGSLSHPTCNASTKGVTNFFANGGASDDTLRICVQLSGGSYAWKDLIN